MAEKSNKYFYETDNLGFRYFTTADYDHLAALNRDAESRQYFKQKTMSATEIQARLDRYIQEAKQKGYSAFIVFDLKTNEFIGQGGFHDFPNTIATEIGYGVLKKHWNKGYATRIVRALLKWAQANLKQDKLIAITAIDNKPSERVMQKCGMTFRCKEIIDDMESLIYEISLRK